MFDEVIENLIEPVVKNTLPLAVTTVYLGENVATRSVDYSLFKYRLLSVGLSLTFRI